MMRMWMRSCSSFQVHSSAMLSTSRMQLGGIQVTGGGKRSTPRTLAASVNTDLGLDMDGMTYLMGTCRRRHWKSVSYGLMGLGCGAYMAQFP